MFPCACAGYGSWWMIPIIMIGMMVLCFFMMRGRMGSMMCRPGFRRKGTLAGDASESAPKVLDKREDS